MSSTDLTHGRAAIVGGGPAGLMAAEILASAGLEATVYDHMASVGRKFLLAGRGGLNLTHSEPLDDFLTRYRVDDPHGRELLTSAIGGFGPSALRVWCEELGEATIVGSSGRVFPESFRATPLLRAWLSRLQEQGVTIAPRHRWVDWALPDPDAAVDLTFETSDGGRLNESPDVVVLAMGGASWPRVGSDGGWRQLCVAAGIDVRPFASANCGVKVAWTSTMRERFAGQPIKNIALTCELHPGHPVRGDIVITDDGLEGGPVYAMSSPLRDSLTERSPSTLIVDLQPDLDTKALTKRLRDRRRAKDSASTWLRRSGFHPTHVALMREATGNQISAEAEQVADLAKSLPLDVTALMPLDRAISSAGGVAFSEVTDDLMLHKRPGVFVAGEMLDWEAPTGGYLLQATFSTAAAAAHGALAYLRER